MDRSPHILTFHFHKEGESDQRYSDILNALNTFIEEFDAAKQDYTTSTRLFYTTASLASIWANLLETIYTETTPYNKKDKITIFSPNHGEQGNDVLVSYLTEHQGTHSCGITPKYFQSYFNQLEPRSNYKTEHEQLLDELCNHTFGN